MENNIEEHKRKCVTINGKSNVYKYLKANFDEEQDKYNIRNGMENIDECLLDHNLQKNIINNIFIGSTTDNKDYNLIKRELEKKIAGYKKQDIDKKIFDNKLLISFDDLLQKLISSKLKCYYCCDNVYVLYKNVREQKQWTLDRINNDLCHSNENTLIACLNCNLRRRLTDMEKFDFTKKLRISKVD
jgi:hypothetical protein